MKQSTRRRLAYGSNATLVTVMVLGALVLLYVLADLYRVRWDLSEGASNTLAPETLEKLRLLDADGEKVTITAFTHQAGKEDTFFKDRAVRDLLREVGENSRVVEWRQVDFDRERLTAEKLGVREYGRIVIQRGSDRVDIRDREQFRRVGKGQDRRTEFVGEAALARGLAQLMTPSRRVLYVLTGHGELDPEEHGPNGLSELVADLDRERYDVETLDLLRTDREGELPTVPEDAAAVFVARPKAALSPNEEDALLAWIGRGGGVLFAVDAGVPAPALLDRLGVTVADGVALQPEMQVPYTDRPIPVLLPHPITNDLREDKLAVILAHPAPLVLADPVPTGLRATTLLRTTRGGWIELGGRLEGGMAVYEPGIDVQGPVDLAVAIEALPGRGLVRATKPAARIVVVGDGDAFTNALVADGPGNARFAVNAVHWLAREDRRLGVLGSVGRATEVRRLALTRPELGMVRAISLGLMPLVVVLVGAGVWLARRGR